MLVACFLRVYTIGYYFHISQYTKDEVICVQYTGDYNKFGWIDRDGRSIAGHDFYSVHDFCDGVGWSVRATKMNKDDVDYTCELYDLNGNLLLTADGYHPMTHFENGLCLVRKWNNDYSSARDHTCKYMYIDKKGNVVYSWTYSGYDQDHWKPRLIKRQEPQI